MSRNVGALRELLSEEEKSDSNSQLSLLEIAMNGTMNDAAIYNNSNNNKATHVSSESLVDFGNFWRKTQANFTSWENALPDRSPDFKSKGSGGSKYWNMVGDSDDNDYVIRYSNHWSGQHGIGKIVDCEWTINVPHEKKQYIAGMCYYTDFRQGKLNDRERRKLHKLNKKKTGFQS